MYRLTIGFPLAEPADRRQPGQLRSQQRQRRIEVRGDEPVELGAVQPGQPIAQLSDSPRPAWRRRIPDRRPPSDRRRCAHRDCCRRRTCAR